MIPGTAGVAVPPAEMQREILVAESLEIRVARLAGEKQDIVDPYILGQALQSGCLTIREFPVSNAEEVHQIVDRDVMVPNKDPAPHVVEEDVREMMRPRLGAARELEAIGAAHILAKILTRLSKTGLESGAEPVLGSQ